jgi:hypothetical protein
VLAIEHAVALRESMALMIREIMELEIAQIAGAEHGGRVRIVIRPNATSTASGAGTLGLGRSSLRFRGPGPGVICRASSSRAGAQSRRCSPLSRRPVAMTASVSLFCVWAHRTGREPSIASRPDAPYRPLGGVPGSAVADPSDSWLSRHERSAASACV